MKPHPRPPIIRKTIKWGGAVVTVLLVVVWIGSGWWSPQCKAASGYGGKVTKGMLGIAKGEPIATGWFRIVPTTVKRYRFHWWIDYVPASEVPNSPGSIVYIPLWLLVAPLSAMTVIAWRADSRASVAECERPQIAKYSRERPGTNVFVAVVVVGVILLLEWILHR